MWHHARASAGKIAGHTAPTMLSVADQSSLTHQVNPEMKAKYRKEKQTESFAPLSILAMSISLALSPYRRWPAGQAQGSGMIATSQRRNMRSAYTNVPIFLALKNTKNVTKRHGF